MAKTPLRPTALIHYRQPFRASEAIAAGLITRSQLRGSSWRRLYRDIYVDARAADDHLLRIAGAGLLLPPGAAISGRSSALLWGAQSAGELDHVEVISPNIFGPVAGLRIQVGVLPPSEVKVFKGVLATRPEHTAWELARSLPLLDAVAWIDSMARVRRLTKDALVAHGHLHHGVRGCRLADDALAMCDPRAESPPESVLRVHLHLAGIAVIPQFWIMDGKDVVARLDLALPEIRLAIEYDGQWHADHHQLGRDRARVRSLNQMGWHVFQVTKEDMRNIGQLVQNIKAVIKQLS